MAELISEQNPEIVEEETKAGERIRLFETDDFDKYEFIGIEPGLGKEIIDLEREVRNLHSKAKRFREAYPEDEIGNMSAKIKVKLAWFGIFDPTPAELKELAEYTNRFKQVKHEQTEVGPGGLNEIQWPEYEAVLQWINDCGIPIRHKSEIPTLSVTLDMTDKKMFVDQTNTRADDELHWDRLDDEIIANGHIWDDFSVVPLEFRMKVQHARESRQLP